MNIHTYVHTSKQILTAILRALRHCEITIIGSDQECPPKQSIPSVTSRHSELDSESHNRTHLGLPRFFNFRLPTKTVSHKEARERNSAHSFAFTLAEVLIVLGIIGVVAQMTIPTLQKSVQKQVTVTKLQKAYTTLYQAIRLSEIDNGDISTWDFVTCKDDGAKTLDWFNTYLAPYMKPPIKTTVDTTRIYVYLQDGSIVAFWNNGTMHVFVYLNGINKFVSGKDYFTFFVGDSLYVGKNREIKPYDFNIASITDRTSWINDGTYGCNKSNPNKLHCAGLIMHDGWQIKDDYPYFN